MLTYREALSIGMGMRLDPDLVAASKALSRKDRRRAAACARRGEAAWDVPSARFAASMARSTMRRPMAYGKRGTQVAIWVLVAVFALEASWSISDGDVGRSIFFVAFGGFFALGAWRLPGSIRNAPRAFELNDAMLEGHERPAREEPSYTRLELWTARLITAAYMGTSFALLTWWLESGRDGSGDNTAVSLVLRGIFFGVFMVAFSAWFARRKERQEQREATPEPQHDHVEFHP